MKETMKENTELKVFISSRDSSCNEYGEDLGRGAWITLVEGIDINRILNIKKQEK
ncbi:MAG: hypothetical protein KAV18_00810 [Candidatus Omnitrophica bacterium]|nr:hypothetical protein [Candidatus Omnitrophota bacterium]